jgi:peptidoglycan/LPS O-acetylase OafA/YrhL
VSQCLAFALSEFSQFRLESEDGLATTTVTPYSGGQIVVVSAVVAARGQSPMMDAVPPVNRLAGHLPTLDGWRGVAVLMVVVFHADAATSSRLSPIGALGVSIFFALSGLLICNRLLVEYARAGRIDLAGFYVRRVFRILPPALVYLTVLAGLGVATDHELAACLFFWRNYTTGGWYTDHFWSLAVEEHFYLSFPVILAVAGPRRGLPITAAVLVALSAWRVLDTNWVWLFERTRAVQQTFRTDCRLADLLFGALAALMVARIPAWAVRVVSVSSGLFVLALLAGRQMPWGVPSALLPWLLIGTVLRPDGGTGRILEWSPLAWVGRMSYSLYLWQQLFFGLRPSHGVPALGWVQKWPWNAIALLACAATSHYLLERPLTRFGRLLAERLRQTPAPPKRAATDPPPATDIAMPPASS